jgi:hypothetical protein
LSGFGATTAMLRGTSAGPCLAAQLASAARRTLPQPSLLQPSPGHLHAPTRCLRCFNLHHIAKDCRRSHKLSTGSPAAGAAQLPRRETCHRRDASSKASPHISDTTRSTQREDVTSRGGAAAGPTPSPPPRRFTPLPPQLDRRGVLPRVASHLYRRSWMPPWCAS